MSIPASACLRTTSATASAMRRSSASPSIGTPSSRAYMMRTRSSGRGRLPVCVVRNRSVLRVIAAHAMKSDCRIRHPGCAIEAGYNQRPFSLHLPASMNVLFEDDGQLKAGSLLADHDASLQVESVSGKRQKIKAAHVLLRFAAPSPAETMARAQELVAELDPNLLWEGSVDDEFGFDELAREYYGSTPAPAQSA